MARKKRKQERRADQVRVPPGRLLEELSEAKSLMRRGRRIEAAQALEALDQRYPNRVEVLAALADVYYELRDTRKYQALCERWLKVTPDNPDVMFALGGTYMTNMRPALALRTLRRFLDRWPDHERADEARKVLASLEAHMDDLMGDLGLPGEEGLQLAALHEEVQGLLEQGAYRQALQVAEALLRRRPDFAPAWNNISQVHFIEGRMDQAIAAAQQVLSFDADNFHALSNLARYLCLCGRIDEARECATRLKAVESEAVDVWVKKAEASSYLGDDQGVLDAFAGARQAGHLKPPLANPVLYHLAAVAALRLGQEKEADQYWRQAGKSKPGLDLVEDNLADLRRPVGERHAPWAFGLANWVGEKAVRDLWREVEAASRRSKDAVHEAARRYLRRHPEIAALVPILLDRGDPRGREFALRLALLAETPEMLEALRDFALSQRGPDAMRTEAARKASEAGLLPPGPVRLWAHGAWREILLLDWELHSAPMAEHRPQVETWSNEAILALRRGEGDRAESLLRQALAEEPDAPDLLNNLAAAHKLQGRLQETEDILRQVHGRYPDDVFARTGLAKLHVSRGETDQADALLRPLLRRRRFHLSEFGSFCDAQIALDVARDRLDVARSWLDMWATADPDQPDIERWRARTKNVRWLDKPKSQSRPRTGLRRQFFGQRVDKLTGGKKARPAVEYKVGDVVRVKPGTACPDAPGLDIGNWQGRVTDLSHVDDEKEPAIGFAWDSCSLQAMPAWFIQESAEEGLDWSSIYLGPDEIEPAQARDTEQDAEQARRAIQKRAAWLGIGPDGTYIQEVVNTAQGSGEQAVIRAWGQHLKQVLQFPFEAEVDEYQERGPLQAGDRLTVLRIAEVDEFYGVIVSGRQGRQHVHLALADLAAVDARSSNAEPIQAYQTWFANR